MYTKNLKVLKVWNFFQFLAGYSILAIIVEVILMALIESIRTKAFNFILVFSIVIMAIGLLALLIFRIKYGTNYDGQFEIKKMVFQNNEAPSELTKSMLCPHCKKKIPLAFLNINQHSKLTGNPMMSLDHGLDSVLEEKSEQGICPYCKGSFI